MKTKKYWILLVVVGVFAFQLLWAAKPKLVPDKPTEPEAWDAVLKPRSPMVGLKGVTVTIATDDTLKKLGLHTDTLKTDVELKLRLAGIRVIAEEDRVWSMRPYLIVSLIVVEGTEFVPSAFYIELLLQEKVQLARSLNTTVIATTWSSRGWLGVAGKTVFVNSVRKRLKDQVDQFLNDYLAANPKDQEKTTLSERLKMKKQEKKQGKNSIYD